MYLLINKFKIKYVNILIDNNIKNIYICMCTYLYTHIHTYTHICLFPLIFTILWYSVITL